MGCKQAKQLRLLHRCVVLTHAAASRMLDRSSQNARGNASHLEVQQHNQRWQQADCSNLIDKMCTQGSFANRPWQQACLKQFGHKLCLLRRLSCQTARPPGSTVRAHICTMKLYGQVALPSFESCSESATLDGAASTYILLVTPCGMGLAWTPCLKWGVPAFLECGSEPDPCCRSSDSTVSADAVVSASKEPNLLSWSENGSSSSSLSLALDSGGGLRMGGGFWTLLLPERLASLSC